ncbi:helix-turn-helix domain-containing protein [Zhongshania sp.]|uniref:helix-turn-helix domain-containing protein n=1 Tax=Zhongshania sp. TaxID=1971902 RepID=UPI00356AD27C
MATTEQGASKPRAVQVQLASDRRSRSRSATRALDVLEYFGLMRRPLRAIEIARALNLHPSTTNQLLKTMVGSAHLTFDGSAKTYLPSPRLARFSHWISDTYGGDRLWRLIRNVQAESGVIVTLTTPNDLFMQVVDIVGAEPDARAFGGEQRGLSVSIFGSVIGAAYLATQTDREIARLAERARLAPAEQSSVYARLSEIRRRGFVDGPNADESVWSLAAPLKAELFAVPLVLGLAGPKTHVINNLNELKALIRREILLLG